MLKQFIFFALFCLSTSIFSQEWHQNSTQALFSIKKLGVKVAGNFKDAEVHTNFDSNNLENSYLNLRIRVKSISMNKKNRKKTILQKKYFFEENYKFIHFKSSSIEKNENGDLFLVGTLKIKGVTKKVHIPFKVLESNQKITIKSNFKIRTKDFNIGENDVSLSKSANIELEFTGTT